MVLKIFLWSDEAHFILDRRISKYSKLSHMPHIQGVSSFHVVRGQPLHADYLTVWSRVCMYYWFHSRCLFLWDHPWGKWKVYRQECPLLPATAAKVVFAQEKWEFLKTTIFIHYTARPPISDNKWRKCFGITLEVIG